ncbi:hypothetical protein DEU56DRAFT_556493 [Suillus clintonianus]|uniref:uncharacterized protein n=1 Tax=Suillus clintonianus TaxID=1904413 RepID=UPI001B885155|nr:uncharacterized protein DEU56DRAFT_556493 [Suillus clintonianus]KAG2126230.1 hypothetical protein DEU56DRAFT_556493 [Suillus clintonianus]
MAQLDLNSTFGALYIGAAIGAIFFGLSNVQVFLYFQSRRNSGFTFYKFAVCWLWFLDALHVALVNHMIYYYLISNYANPLALLEMVWSFKALIVIDVCIVYSVHLLYLQRIWIISRGRTRFLPVFMTVLIVLASSVGFVLFWAVFKSYLFTDLAKIRWTIYLSLGTMTMIDFLIACSLCYLLASAKTGFTKTDMTLRTLVRDIINTGCLTSMCSMACIITDASMPNNFVFLAIEFLLSKLYVNSYMALLNARHYLGSDGGSHSSQNRTPHVYRPELPVDVLRESQDRSTPQTSNVDKFQISDSALEHANYYPPASARSKMTDMVV